MSKYPDADTHYRTCNLCEAMCGLVIQHKDGKILSIKGDKEDPLSQGHICPKAIALQDLHQDPDRLKHPIKRTEDGWKEISWEAAFDEVAKNIKGLQKKYGNDAIGMYAGNPSVHNYGTLLFSPQLARVLRTKNKFSATSVDQLPHHFVAQFMLGHWLSLPVPDIDRTDFFLVLGANPMASNGSMMTVPNFPRRLRALQERGGKMVVIDPRKSETALKADTHHFIQPGTDVLLLLALLHVIFKENRVNLGHLESHTKGLDEVKKIVLNFSPERVEKNCKISAEEITQLARDFSDAKTASCYGRMGISVQSFGTLCQWLVYVLNIVTNNFDKAGGIMFPKPAVPVVRGGSTMKKFNRWESRKRKLPEFNGELPVACLAEEILEEGSGQIKGLIVSAGNPVLSTPNGPQLDKALEQLDFMVSIDIYLNETSRHANIILPPATGLETDHYDLVFNNLSVRNTVKYSPALFSPVHNTRYDWQIYKALSKRLNQKKLSFTQKIMKAWATPKRLLNATLLTGPYGKWYKGRYNRKGISLRSIKKHPHGLDLGALKPSLPKVLRTKDKKINLSPKVITDDLSRIENSFFSANPKKTNGFDLALISRRHQRSNNSWMHNSTRLIKGRNRCTLMIHPRDAEQRKFKNNQIVEVSSAIGKVKIEVEITDEMFQGTVSIPHGYGHGRDGVRLQVAQENPGVSINDLSDDSLIDELTGNAAFSGTPVRVRPLPTP